MAHVTKFSNKSCEGSVTYNDVTKIYTFTGTSNGSIEYIAAAPCDFRMSYAGSGLPWPNEDVAYGQTPNRGKVSGDFKFEILYPNAYYVNNGSTMVQPHVHLFTSSGELDVKLGAPLVPNRSLKHLPGRPRRTTGAGRATTGGRN